MTMLYDVFAIQAFEAGLRHARIGRADLAPVVINNVPFSCLDRNGVLWN
jgi:hypothetical protein